MNFLAHIYLSGDDEEIIIGNFIADAIKGNKYNGYSNGIRFGILLHRKIDTFTDNHQVFKQSVQKLRPAYGKFSGAVVDMLYDHFLAAKWQEYSDVPLKAYSTKIYKIIETNSFIFPEKIRYFSTFFIKRDRINCYAKLNCFEDVLLKMGIYTPLPEKSKEGMNIIKENYEEFKTEFKLFFVDIKTYVTQIMLLKEKAPEEILKFR